MQTPVGLFPLHAIFFPMAGYRELILHGVGAPALNGTKLSIKQERGGQSASTHCTFRQPLDGYSPMGPVSAFAPPPPRLPDTIKRLMGWCFGIQVCLLSGAKSTKYIDPG